jgi:hypothetical protein
MLAVPTDLTVILDNRPGELARLGEVTGAAGVNIRGFAAFTGEGRGVIHLLVDDDAVPRATQELQRAGVGIADSREVLVVDIADDLEASVSSRGSSPAPTSTLISRTRRSGA